MFIMNFIRPSPFNNIGKPLLKSLINSPVTETPYTTIAFSVPAFASEYTGGLIFHLFDKISAAQRTAGPFMTAQGSYSSSDRSLASNTRQSGMIKNSGSTFTRMSSSTYRWV
jgi:hypothetical protein